MTASTRDVVLSVEGLKTWFHSRDGIAKSVDGVTFDLARGETLAIVGESGSGKSVTSLSIMGLLPKPAGRIEAGKILFRDRQGVQHDLAHATPATLQKIRGAEIAMIFQEPMTSLNPLYTVGDQIAEAVLQHEGGSYAAALKRAREMLERVEIPAADRRVNEYPHQMSGGMRQRVMIALALACNPAVLIADEPTTALDVTTQKQILALIKELQIKHKTAVLFITHDFGVVAEISDRIVVMNRGDLIESGTRNEILAEPKQSYTRRLVSSVPSLVPMRRDAPDGQPVLHVKGLGRTYGGKSSLFSRKAAQNVIAATDVNLTLRKGEILGIVGESGSGKSTVARCIVRLIEPTAGHMMMGGEDLSTLSGSALRPVRRRIQIVFQDPYRSLNPRRTVGESIIEGLLNFGMPREQALKRAGETLTVVGLSPDAMRRYPHQFSGGQRQRICIARALVMDPEILVADEAVSALDVSVQAQVLELLEQVRQRTGVGVLFITHDLRVAAQICDTIMVMQRGKVVETGSAETVLTEPRHEYTRALIDAAPGRDWDFRNFQPVAATLAQAAAPAP